MLFGTDAMDYSAHSAYAAAFTTGAPQLIEVRKLLQAKLELATVERWQAN